MSKRELHLAVLIDRYLPIVGGAQQITHQIVRRLVLRGMRATVLTRRVGLDLPAEETLDGVRIVRHGHHPSRLRSKLRTIRASTQWLRANRVDAMLAVPTGLVTDLLPTQIAARQTGVRFAVRATALNMFDGMLTWRHPVAGGIVGKLMTPPPLWRAALTNAHAIVAQSQPVYDRVRKYGLENARLCVGGADGERFRPAAHDEKVAMRRALGLPENRVIFITTGRYVPEKNHIALVKAAHAVQATHGGRGLTLILGGTEHGQGEATERELKAYVAAHGLGDAVRFHEDVRNVEDYLRTSDVFVLPTYFDEGLSNALLEAMMCGLAVIASDIPQTTAAVPAEHAIFVPARDEAALARAMERAVEDEPWRRRSGAAMGEHARRHYSLDRVVDFYESLVRELAEERRG